LSELLGGGYVSIESESEVPPIGSDAANSTSPFGWAFDDSGYAADAEGLSPLAWGAIALAVGAGLWAVA